MQLMKWLDWLLRHRHTPQTDPIFLDNVITTDRGATTYLKDRRVGERVAEDEWGDPRTRPREFGKLLREKSAEGGAKDVNFLHGQLREELLESTAPLLNAPVGGGVDSDHTDTARRQSQALKVSLLIRSKYWWDSGERTALCRNFPQRYIFVELIDRLESWYNFMNYALAYLEEEHVGGARNGWKAH